MYINNTHFGWCLCFKKAICKTNSSSSSLSVHKVEHFGLSSDFKL